MNEIQISVTSFTIIACVCSFFLSYIFYIIRIQKETQIKKEELYGVVIKQILGEMYIDEFGNNVLDGGTEEYEKKWKYQIGHNYGLQKAIRIIKRNINL